MKIYTKTGDDGRTGLYGAGRVRKDDPRIDAYGTVDELNAVLGLVRTEMLPTDVDVLVKRLQNELFDLGAELATRDPSAMGVACVGPEQVAALEAAIDDFEEALPPLKEFILPGGTRGTAMLHLARTVCRRAERRVVTLAGLPDEHVSPQVTVYLNRLSDLLFVLARAVNSMGGMPDVTWKKRE